MLSDGLTAEQSEGRAGENVKIIDVAQMLLASVKRGQPESAMVPAASEAVVEAEAITAAAAGAGAAEAAANGDAQAGDAGSEVVPTEPIAAEAVAPYSEEAQKAHDDFGHQAPMADEVGDPTATPAGADAVEDETPAEHLMEHNADLEPTDEDARDEEADELRHEHEDDKPTQA
jgi:hypothetical protein